MEHPNISKYLYFYLGQNHYYILSKYNSNLDKITNLFEALIQQRETPSIYQIATIMHELIMSL